MSTPGSLYTNLQVQLTRLQSVYNDVVTANKQYANALSLTTLQTDITSAQTAYNALTPPSNGNQ